MGSSIKDPLAVARGNSGSLTLSLVEPWQPHWRANHFPPSVGFFPEYRSIDPTEMVVTTETFFDVPEAFSPTCSNISDNQLPVEFLSGPQSMDQMEPGRDHPVSHTDSLMERDRETIGRIPGSDGYDASLDTSYSAQESEGPPDVRKLVITHLEASLADEPITSPSESQGVCNSEGTSRASLDGGYFHLPLSVTVTTPSGGEDGPKRLWEGGLFQIGDHPDVAVQTACCPWATFGKNMERAGFGTSWGQGGVYLLLSVGALSFYIAFACTGTPWFIYGTLSLLLLMAIYAGHYRARLRRRFNIIGSEGGDVVSTIDDHLYHLMCGFCSLCQEARTLKSNNVHNGVWHGRGDILVIGSQVVFSAPDMRELNSASLRRLPSWRMRPAHSKKPVAAESDLEEQYPWSPEDLQSVPLVSQ